jgi:O-antigen/teichoic acid export membrane protein
MHFFRAAGLMAATSVLVPVVGVATAPILAHGLGVAGRGTAAAALAPNVLLAGAATLGLPDALTYFLAKTPGRTRAALRVTCLLSVLIGAAAFVVVAVFASPLSGGVQGLDGLIVLATAFAVPLLLVNLLRGAAIGRHMWTAVAAERVTNSFLRLIALALLLVLDRLTVLNAVLVMAIGPLIAGAVYWRLLVTPAPVETSPAERLRARSTELEARGRSSPIDSKTQGVSLRSRPRARLRAIAPRAVRNIARRSSCRGRSSSR